MRVFKVSKKAKNARAQDEQRMMSLFEDYDLYISVKAH